MQNTFYRLDTRLTDSLHDHMARYGYERLDTSIIEAADLFLTKAGDQLIDKLFTFDRRGRQLALRPEFTAAAAYHYVMSMDDQQPVVRWQFSGPIFTDDTRADHRYQQHSVGAELIGMSGTVAEAEIIALAAHGVILQGVTNWRLVIGHVGLTRRLLERFALDSRTQRFLLNHLSALKDPALGKDHILRALDSLLLGRSLVNGEGESNASLWTAAPQDEHNTAQMLDILLDATERGTTLGGRTRHDIAQRLLEKRQRATERDQIVAALDFLLEWGAIKAPPDEAFAAMETFIAADDTIARGILADWQEVLGQLNAYELPAQRLTIQPDLARTWDYYSGIVFELRTDDGLHIGGGGRYDELAQLVGGRGNVPAVGFAYYMDEFMNALPQNEVEREQHLIIRINSDNDLAEARWAHQLRNRSLQVVLSPADNGAAEVDRTDNLLWNGKVFSLSQIDAFVADWKLFNS
ncbi:MAG: ATP phosphoribosyltransferase regulatory subunit [Burkholderiales bacterium]|nr:ATP phosphoribosyltransferase regulatory subunit [Anaerolineae bacterium]